jgi:hypothetical protein
MNGRLWVTSEPGRGSTFFVEVTVDRLVIETGPVSRTAILWTDDSMTAMLATRVIEKTGTSVQAVMSFEELRQLPQVSTYTLCLVDANVASTEDLKTLRDLMPTARLIVLNHEEGHPGYETADVTLPCPLKPADLRVALT